MSNALDCCLSTVRGHIANGELDLALVELRRFVDSLVSDHRLHGHVFGTKDLDKVCLELGEAVLAGSQSASSEPSGIDVVIVASAFYLSGGHSALAADYIKALANQQIRILITDPDNTVDRVAISNRFSRLCSDIRFSPASTDSLLVKLEWLIAELKAARSEWTIFISNPNDPVAVAAMQRSLLHRTAFVHHTDHTFTLGLYADVDQHIDFRQQGWDNCRNHNGLSNNVLVPLSAPDYGCPEPQGRFHRSAGIITCTSGNGKFEFPYSYQLTRLIPQWLEATGGKHIHIGNLSPLALESLDRSMQELEIDSSRLKIVPWVESLWKAVVEHQVDLYIDSFPICGCRALVEVMGAGVPVVVHHNYESPMFSNEGFAHEMAATWRTPEELLGLMRTMDTRALERYSVESREHYLKNHTPEHLQGDLRTMLSGGLPESGETRAGYQTDDLRAFLDGFASQAPNSDLQQFASMFQMIALAEGLRVSEERFEELVGPYVSRSALSTYRDSYKRVRNCEGFVELVNSVYSIEGRANDLNQERVSRVLFALSQLTDDTPVEKSPGGHRALYHRIKRFWTTCKGTSH